VIEEFQSPLPLPGASILVVDDVEVVRKTVFRFLSEVGYRVFEAASATEALEVLFTARPPVKLVIADVVMPEVSGVGLIRQVQEQLGDTRVLYMSAFPAEIMVREGITRPTVLFLAKPFTRDELLAKVAAALAAPPDRDASRPASGSTTHNQEARGTQKPRGASEDDRTET
jgi:two-component system cell cycle sensor histidine kinase/response regulator CckA